MEQRDFELILNKVIAYIAGRLYVYSQYDENNMDITAIVEMKTLKSIANFIRQNVDERAEINGE